MPDWPKVLSHIDLTICQIDLSLNLKKWRNGFSQIDLSLEKSYWRNDMPDWPKPGLKKWRNWLSQTDLSLDKSYWRNDMPDWRKPGLKKWRDELSQIDLSLGKSYWRNGMSDWPNVVSHIDVTIAHYVKLTYVTPIWLCRSFRTGFSQIDLSLGTSYWRNDRSDWP
jgi:hypothetical protein